MSARRHMAATCAQVIESYHDSIAVSWCDMYDRILCIGDFYRKRPNLLNEIRSNPTTSAQHVSKSAKLLSRSRRAVRPSGTVRGFNYHTLVRTYDPVEEHPETLAQAFPSMAAISGSINTFFQDGRNDALSGSIDSNTISGISGTSGIPGVSGTSGTSGVSELSAAPQTSEVGDPYYGFINSTEQIANGIHVGRPDQVASAEENVEGAGPSPSEYTYSHWTEVRANEDPNHGHIYKKVFHVPTVDFTEAERAIAEKRYMKSTWDEAIPPTNEASVQEILREPEVGVDDTPDE